ncbi:MAG: serine/threonine-protein kinase [Pseudomonadota bacterium]
MTVICPYCRKKIETDPGVIWVKCTGCREKINLSSLGTTPKPRDMPFEQDLAGMDFGKYHLEELIGIGGMGVVYRATGEDGKAVAVKILYYSSGENEIIKKRFDRETEILESLDHKNIVKLIDKGRHENYMYIVMEHIPFNLAAKLRESGLSPGEVAALIADVTEALSYAHDRKIIHRDLKPTNILLTGEGAKISDFGIAHVEYEKDKTSLTQTAAILGTFNYMSPEQRMGEKDTDRRADIYSLGVLLYELFTGRVPIGNFPKVSQLRKDVSKTIDRVIEKALSQDRTERYDDVKAFEAACMGALAGDGNRKGRVRLALTALIFFTLGAGLYYGYLRSGRGRDSAAIAAQADLVAPRVALGTLDRLEVNAPANSPAEQPQPQASGNSVNALDQALAGLDNDDAGNNAVDEPQTKQNRKNIAVPATAGQAENKKKSKGGKEAVVDTKQSQPAKAGKGQGYLVATTKPEAGVSVDGKPTGRKTPITKTSPIMLNQGPHKVSFSLPSGKTHTFTVTIKAGMTTKVNKDFESTPDTKTSSKDDLNPYTDQKTSIGKPKPKIKMESYKK